MATMTWEHGEDLVRPHRGAVVIPPALLARIAGVLYLLVGVLGSFSIYTRSVVRITGDAAATAESIRASMTLFRAGFVADLVHLACLATLALVLYALFSPVNATIARAFVLFIALATAIMAVNLVNHAGAMMIVTDPAYVTAFGVTSADALALLFLDLHNRGFEIAQLFFGLWLLPLGYVVYRSGYVPRVLGVALMLGCVGYLAQLVFIYASPDGDAGWTLVLALGAGLAETAFLLWLLVKGVSVPRRNGVGEV